MRKRPVGLGLVRICNTKCIWQRYRVFLTLDGESQQPSLYIRTEWRSNVQTSPVFLFSFKSFFGLQGKPSPPKPCFCLAMKQKQHMALEVLLNSVLTHFAWRGIVCAQHSHGDFCSWALRATLLIFWTPFSCRRGVGTFLLIDRVFFFCEAGCLAAASTSHYLTDLQGFFMRLFGMYRTGQETEWGWVGSTATVGWMVKST